MRGRLQGSWQPFRRPQGYVEGSFGGVFPTEPGLGWDEVENENSRRAGLSDLCEYYAVMRPFCLTVNPNPTLFGHLLQKQIYFQSIA